MKKKQKYVIIIKTDKRIDLNKVDKALKTLDSGYELQRFEEYIPMRLVDMEQ